MLSFTTFFSVCQYPLRPHCGPLPQSIEIMPPYKASFPDKLPIRNICVFLLYFPTLECLQMRCVSMCTYVQCVLKPLPLPIILIGMRDSLKKDTFSA